MDLPPTPPPAVPVADNEGLARTMCDNDDQTARSMDREKGAQEM